MVDLPNGGKLTSAAIYGQDGGCWAQSAGFPTVRDVRTKQKKTKQNKRRRERERERLCATSHSDKLQGSCRCPNQGDFSSCFCYYPHLFVLVFHKVFLRRCCAASWRSIIFHEVLLDTHMQRSVLKLGLIQQNDKALGIDLLTSPTLFLFCSLVLDNFYFLGLVPFSSKQIKQRCWSQVSLIQ